MTIHEHYYNDDNRMLYIEFSTIEDGDSFYRTLELSYNDIEYYSPEIINENDLHEIDEDFIKDVVNQYLSENDLPDQIVL
jgi:hypothetical protein